MCNGLESDMFEKSSTNVNQLLVFHLGNKFFAITIPPANLEFKQ